MKSNEIDSADAYIGRYLKKAVERQKTPVDGKDHLLQSAAALPTRLRIQVAHRLTLVMNEVRLIDLYPPIDWSQKLLEWTMLNTFRNGVARYRLLL
jgi:hypothetical protein